MKHDTPILKARRRERCGSRYASRLRKTGRLPAIVYGHQTPPVPVSVDETEILNLIRHGAHALNLEIEGSGTETCLVKDLQYGYLGDNVVHVDFARVALDEEVTVQVHLAFVGTAPESLKADAILQHDLTDLTVTCKVQDIPDEIKVDLSKMEGTHLTAGEVTMPPGVLLAVEPGTMVASVSQLRKVDVETGEEAEVEEAAAEPEVITEARDDDDADDDKKREK